MDERSIIRWQHRLKRERPTCTERTKSLTRVRMEGWRQWLTRPEKKPCPTKKQQNPLDSDRPSHGRRLRSSSLARDLGLRVKTLRSSGFDRLLPPVPVAQYSKKKDTSQTGQSASNKENAVGMNEAERAAQTFDLNARKPLQDLSQPGIG